jgi:hypothetical protein
LGVAGEQAHCIEGALLAALALYLRGEKPLLLDLKTKKTDQEHVVALFRKNGYWGALSKTNHAVLRYRDPVYRTVRELALSYFHEYFLVKDGDKTLLSYSRPFSLEPYDHEWMTSEENLFGLAADLDDSPHFSIVPASHRRFLRRASRVEVWQRVFLSGKPETDGACSGVKSCIWSRSRADD